MILSEKVAGIIKDLEIGIIKDLEIQVGIKDMQLNSAMRRIEELVTELAELKERLQDR